MIQRLPQPFNDYNGAESHDPPKAHETPLQICSVAGFIYTPKQAESLISSGFLGMKKTTIILSKLPWTFGGELGIRTLGTFVHSISSAAPSTTRTTLRLTERAITQSTDRF